MNIPRPYELISALDGEEKDVAFDDFVEHEVDGEVVGKASKNKSGQ